MDSRLRVSTSDDQSELYTQRLLVSALPGVTLSQLPRKYRWCRQAGQTPLGINCSVNPILTLKPASASSHRQHYASRLRPPGDLPL